MKNQQEKKTLATTFDAELLHRFRAMCAVRGERMNAVLARFMAGYINKKDGVKE